MEKLETLINIPIGRYDTPKKINRSDTIIPQSVIKSIENSDVTSELINQVAQSIPIYHYKTCLTIHGSFGKFDIPRIAGYKNIIQNQNGSIEILYSAIDIKKKLSIARLMKGTDWRFWRDSRGDAFQIFIPITKDNYQGIVNDLQTKVEAIKKCSFWGNAGLYKVNHPYLGLGLHLHLSLRAIFGSDITDLSCRLLPMRSLS